MQVSYWSLCWLAYRKQVSEPLLTTWVIGMTHELYEYYKVYIVMIYFTYIHTSPHNQGEHGQLWLPIRHLQPLQDREGNLSTDLCCHKSPAQLHPCSVLSHSTFHVHQHAIGGLAQLWSKGFSWSALPLETEVLTLLVHVGHDSTDKISTTFSQ